MKIIYLKMAKSRVKWLKEMEKIEMKMRNTIRGLIDCMIKK